MSTIFSKIITREIPANIIAENEEFIAFLDVSPLVEGHALVVPKLEVDYIFEMDDALLGKMMVFAKQVAIQMKRAIPCTRIGVSVIGLEVPHTHIHLIPMNNVSDMNFAKPKLSLDAAKMSEIAALIKNA